jgi:V8-like Glu-specific endopeptidase
LAAPLICVGAAAALLLAGAHDSPASAAPSPRAADDHLRPFSSVGRLEVQYGATNTNCTATLVGDNRTLITASHCVQPGATRLIFHLGNQGPGVEASVVARGDTPIPGNERDFDAAAPEPGEDKAPSPYWDDWLVLDLARPVAGEPLRTAADPLTMRLQQGDFARTPFSIAGFPIDVESGRRMVWVDGPGIPAFPARSWRGAHAVPTEARTAEGMSGGAVLIAQGGDYVVVGVVSGGVDDETLIVVGGGGLVSVDRKRLADCRKPEPGLTFSAPC